MSYGRMRQDSFEVTIANGGTTSTAWPIRHMVAFNFDMPSAFTGTSVEVEVARTKDGPWKSTLFATAGGPITTDVAANKLAVTSLPVIIENWARLKVDAQAAARTIIVNQQSWANPE